MNYSAIKLVDVANGDGVRVSLFVSGCSNKCKGCFNPETWNFKYGNPFDETAQAIIVEQLARPYINGLTLLGGDPFEIDNQKALLPFLRRVRERFKQKTIWAYTGYVYGVDLSKNGKVYCDATDPILDLIDVLVDGPFVESQKDISLRFRGSTNQRIINLCEIRRKLEFV